MHFCTDKCRDVHLLRLVQAIFFGLTACSVYQKHSDGERRKKITFPHVQYAIFLALNVAYPLVCKKVLTTLHCKKDEEGDWRMVSGPMLTRTVFAAGETVGTLEKVHLTRGGI